MMRTLTPSVVSQSASTRPVGPAPIIRTSVCAICYTPLQLSRRPQRRATHRGNSMRNRGWSRRDVLKMSTALAAGTLFAEPARAAAPPPATVTPELIEAARKEGKLSYYSAHYLDWKSKDWLAPYLPDDVARYFPEDQVDPDGLYATSCAWIETIGYN